MEPRVAADQERRVSALKRVYSEPAGALAWKGAALIVLTTLLNKLASFAAIRLTLALV